MHLAGPADALVVSPNRRFPVNKGGLCIKGWTATATLAHPDRLRSPLMREKGGPLNEVSWDTALAAAAESLRRAQQRYGVDAAAVLGGGSLTNEKAYWLGKFARVGLGTANIDYNGRFCMSSAAAAGTRALGVDRGLPFPLDDIARTAAILLVGGNPAETMPPIMQYFETQQRAGGTLTVVDPRRTPTASWASRHVRIRPGTDAAFANGLLHVLVRDRLLDEAFVAQRTEDFESARRVALTYWPERVEQLTGVPERAIVETAHLLAKAPHAMVLTARGPEQHSQGVINTLAYINVALALGLPGKAVSGFGTITGQGNGQGGREHGQKTDQLPGYRSLTDPAARRHIASVWNVPEPSIPRPGKSAFELLDALGRDIHALFVMGFNPAVSAPESLRVADRLRSLDTLIVSDFFLSETAALADIVFPTAQWAEENGTTTNLEGRVILRRAAVEPPDGVRTDLAIISGLAARLGKAPWFPTSTAQDVFDELRLASQGGMADYFGITYDRIEANDGVFWPCPALDHPGTPRLFADRFPTPSGRARFHATPHQDMADPRDADFPLHLTTGRSLAHYQTATQTKRIAELSALAPEPVAEIHPLTARMSNLTDGGRVTLTSRRGSASFVVKITRAIREDTVFVPFHGTADQHINRLTIAALDPISRMPEFKACAVRATNASAEPPQ